MANTLYYGGGNCSIEASDIFGLEIKYKGRIKILDKTSDHYHIIANNKKIIIFSTNRVDSLNDLFEYQGELKIKSVLAADSNAKKVRVIIKRVMDYSELLDTNAEDMNTNSEKLRANHRHGISVKATTPDINIITHLQTISDKGLYGTSLYYKNGTPYHGSFHIHMDGVKIMSGQEHTDASEELSMYPNGWIRGRSKKQTVPTPMARRGGSSGGSGSSSGGGGY